MIYLSIVRAEDPQVRNSGNRLYITVFINMSDNNLQWIMVMDTNIENVGYAFMNVQNFTIPTQTA